MVFQSVSIVFVADFEPIFCIVALQMIFTDPDLGSYSGLLLAKLWHLFFFIRFG